jgi:hypothetical protein
MSDERLEELGLERRAFLKKAALAGFVAPVIASFALEGTATAGSQRCRDFQIFGYQNDNCQVNNNNQ